MGYNTKFKSVSCTTCGETFTARRAGRVACDACKRAKRREHNQQPERKAKRREYSAAQRARLVKSGKIADVMAANKIRRYAVAEARARGVAVEAVLAEMGAL